MSAIAIILAGPNGAGKTSTAPLLLRDTLAVDEFVNADTIAQGLCAFAPETVAFEAGQILLARLRELAAKSVNFAVETTLAARTYHALIQELNRKEYQTHLVFLALPNVEIAIERVINRVKLGGHGIPAEVIRRRYQLGLKNLFHLYMPLVSSWQLYDNVLKDNPRMIAEKKKKEVPKIVDISQYEHLQRYSRYNEN